MNHITYAESGAAPRLLAGWEAILSAAADGAWHARAELIDAATATGLAPKTAANLLQAATGRSMRPHRLRYRNKRAEFRLP